MAESLLSLSELTLGQIEPMDVDVEGQEDEKIEEVGLQKSTDEDKLPVLEAMKGFVKIWGEEKVRNKILGYLDRMTMIKLRMTCSNMDQAVTKFPYFRDGIIFRFEDDDSIDVFAASKVHWKTIRISYWPTYLPRNETDDAFLFWEANGKHVQEIHLDFLEGQQLMKGDLLDILPIPKTLKSVSLSCNLSGIYLWDYGEKLVLHKTFSNLKELSMNYLGKINKPEVVSRQIDQLTTLAKFIPSNQLTGFYVDDGFRGFPSYAVRLNVLMADIIQAHAKTLRILQIVATDIFAPALIKICENEGLELEECHIDLRLTCKIVEKADALTIAAKEQVKAWRAFVKLLQRSSRLRKLSMILHCFTKKMGKRLFSDGLLNSIRHLFLYSDSFQSEESLHILGSFKNLASLHLEKQGFGVDDLRIVTPMQLKDINSNFLTMLPTSLTSFQLRMFPEFPPVALLIILKTLVNLEEFKLYSCEPMLNDESMQAICQYGTKLRILHLSPATNVGDKGISGKYRLSSLTGLKELIFTDSKITNSSLRKEFNFKFMETLVLNHTARITERAIKEVLVAIPNLRIVGLKGMKMSDLMVKKLQKNHMRRLIFERADCEIEGHESCNHTKDHWNDPLPQVYNWVNPDEPIVLSKDHNVNDFIHKILQLDELTKLENSFSGRVADLTEKLEGVDVTQTSALASMNGEEADNMPGVGEGSREMNGHSEGSGVIPDPETMIPKSGNSPKVYGPSPRKGGRGDEGYGNKDAELSDDANEDTE